MEPRKIIKFGNSSYVITLPFDWVKKNELEKGSSLNMIENEDSILIKVNKEENLKEAHINIDDKPLKLFNRQLISYYLKNFKYIKVFGENIMEKLDDIRIFKEKLSSVEIVEINPKYILLKDLSNPKELNICSIIKEIIEMEKLFFEELLKEDKNKVYQVISNLDKNINKLSFLAYKSLNFNQNSFEKQNEAINSIFYWRIVSSLENIGDIIKRISRYLKSDSTFGGNANRLLFELKNYFIFVTDLFLFSGNIENNLIIHLDKKQSLLKELENLRSNFSENLNLYLVITQLLKDIIGQLEEIVVSVIDLRN